MPDVAPTQTAAPAANPPSTPQPTSDKNERHPGVRKLLESFSRMDTGSEPEPEPTKPEPATPENKPEPKPEPAPKAEAKPEPEDEPIKVRQKKAHAPKRPEIPVAQKAPPTPAPIPVPSPAPVAKEEEPMPEIYPEEQQQIDEAKELEKRFPGNARYKGLAAKVEKYIREHAKYADDPNFDETDPAYQAFLKTRPQISARDLAQLEVARAEERWKKENEEGLSKVRQETFERDEVPKVERETTQIFHELAKTELVDELAATIKEHGVEEAQKRHPLEFSVTELVLKAATDDIKEFKLLTRLNPSTGRAIKQYDPNNPVHQRLDQMVVNVCDQFRQNTPEAQQVKNGKWFVTRDEWNNMPAEERGKYWTFSNDEIVQQALRSIKPATQRAIDERRAEMKKYGWMPQPITPASAPAATAPSAPPPPRPAQVPPAPRPAPVPPSSTASKPADTVSSHARTLASRFTQG